MQAYLYPPYLYLAQVLDHCPQAGATYLMLWRDIGKVRTMSYDKNDIVNIRCIAWKKFKTDLRLLVREGLLEFAMSEDDSRIEVTLAELDPDSNFFGKIPC